MDISRPITAVLVACLSCALQAATLERLSLDDMVSKSTDIVRGRVSASSAALRGNPGRAGMIYTFHRVQILERWKGGSASQIDVAVPGGEVQGIRQTFAGAPALQPNTEYILFLWTSRSGLTQIIGLSQGIMNLKIDSAGKTVLSRSVSGEPMVDAYGRPVSDNGFAMSLADFRSAMSRFGLAGVER